MIIKNAQNIYNSSQYSITQDETRTKHRIISYLKHDLVSSFYIIVVHKKTVERERKRDGNKETNTA